MGIQERKERERDARKRSILDATRELLRERGFGGTTTKLIAARCELSEAAVFWYFASKEEILTALFFEGLAYMAGRFDEILGGAGDPREKLLALLLFFGEIRTLRPEYFQLYTYVAQPSGAAELSAKLKTELARHSGQLFHRTVELVREIAGPTDAKVRVDLLWSACVGLTVLRDARANLDLRGTVHPTPADLRRAAQIMLDGIVGPPVGTKRGGGGRR
jgi:AcrR family transcriptional regulator